MNIKHLSSLLLLLLLAACQTATVHGPVYQSVIQAGIDAAADGDTVLVQPGTYIENINFYGKSIVVASLFLTTGDTSYISRTIIDGNGSGSVVMFENQEDTAAVLIGFTITNGYARGDWPENCGGGIYCDLVTSPRLEHLRVIGNGSENKGGGIFCYSNASPSLVNVTVSQNIADIGGGIYFEYESSPSLMNVTVSENMADYGGGIYCYSNSRPSLVNVLVSGNTAAGSGGGIQCYFSSPILVNVTVSGNTAFRGGGIYCGANSSPSLVNTILWNNAPQEIFFSDSEFLLALSSIRIAYSDVQGGKSGIVTEADTVYWLEGNIATNPRFVDAENGDFHLQGDSPCIDAGTAFFTWGNDTLVDLGPDDYTGSAPDMGAFEYGTISVAGNTVPAHR